MLPSAVETSAAAPGSHRRRRSYRWIIWPLLVVILAGLIAWLLYLGLQARHDLNQARADLQSIQAEVDAGNDLSPVQVAAAASASRSAATAVRNPIWRLAARVPWLGSPLKTVAGIAEVSDRLTHDTLPALVGVEQRLQQIKHGDAVSSLSTGNLNGVAGALSSADEQVAEDVYALQHLPAGNPFTSVTSARRKALEQLSSVSSRLHSAAIATRLAASMVGGDTTRTYLVLFENPSEARPDMGLVGGYSLITARSGNIRVAQVGSNTDLPPNPGPSGASGVVLTQGYADLGAGKNWLSSNLSPDFSEDGALLAAMYKSATGHEIDGVVALDPVALGQILTASGQTVSIPGAGGLAGNQLAQFLESGQYNLPLDESARKDVLGDVGRQTIDAVLAAHPSVVGMAKSLADLAATGHVRLYSASPSDEAELAAYPVGGTLPSGPRPFVGAYVIDASARKLDYYLRESVSYRTQSCTTQGVSAEVGIQLANDAPAGLPAFVSEGNVPVTDPAPPGYNTLYLSVVTAAGTQISSASIDGKPVDWALQSVETGDHPVDLVKIEIAPGQTSSLRLVLSEPHATGLPSFGSGVLPTPATFSVSGSCPS